MNSFFGNFNASLIARERSVKENLISTLNQNVKEIQLLWQEQGTDDCLGLIEPTSSLCSTLEAFFLHGLKDSFLWQTINVIGGDVDRRPEPSFWSPMLVFLHKQTIEQVHNLSQITCEAGYCRAWIRLSVSEAFVSSYFNNIRKNVSALNPYYRKYAMLRDTDTLEVAAKILEGIEASVQINLPINSTLLNRWPDLPLQMAGLWTPPLRSCLIADGVDVVSSLTTEAEAAPTPKPLQYSEMFLDGISNSQNSLDLTDKENFQIFLTKVERIQDDMTSLPTNRTCDNDEGDPTKSSVCRSTLTLTHIAAQNQNEELMGNSLAVKKSWTNVDSDAYTTQRDRAEINNGEYRMETTNSEFPFSRSTSTTQSISSLKSPVDHHSYNTLLVRHLKTRELDWNNIWERFESSVGIIGSDSGKIISNANATDSYKQEDEDIEDLNFEILPANLCEKFTTAELHEMVGHACKLSREPGLDSQGFVCKSCAHPLGIGFATAQVCAFTGQYYCEKCMAPDIFSIPAKITYNWDFRKYPVSKKAASFIQEFQYQPFIDFKLLNPEVYSASNDMANLKSLRIRLNFIRAYLFTCCQPIINDLQKQVWSREYLYEYIHRYSIIDLTMIQRGTLAQLLHKAVTFGEQHILNCPLCSVKGFICEICNSPKVLYPFHLESTFRCEICGAVFHDNCLSELQPCPKCERKRRREDLPLIEAIHML